MDEKSTIYRWIYRWLSHQNLHLVRGFPCNRHVWVPEQAVVTIGSVWIPKHEQANHFQFGVRDRWWLQGTCNDQFVNLQSNKPPQKAQNMIQPRRSATECWCRCGGCKATTLTPYLGRATVNSLSPGQGSSSWFDPFSGVSQLNSFLSACLVLLCLWLECHGGVKLPPIQKNMW